MKPSASLKQEAKRIATAARLRGWAFGRETYHFGTLVDSIALYFGRGGRSVRLLLRGDISWSTASARPHSGTHPMDDVDFDAVFGAIEVPASRAPATNTPG